MPRLPRLRKLLPHDWEAVLRVQKERAVSSGVHSDLMTGLQTLARSVGTVNEKVDTVLAGRGDAEAGRAEKVRLRHRAEARADESDGTDSEAEASGSSHTAASQASPSKKRKLLTEAEQLVKAAGDLAAAETRAPLLKEGRTARAAGLAAAKARREAVERERAKQVAGQGLAEARAESPAAEARAEARAPREEQARAEARAPREEQARAEARVPREEQARAEARAPREEQARAEARAPREEQARAGARAPPANEASEEAESLEEEAESLEEEEAAEASEEEEEARDTAAGTARAGARAECVLTLSSWRGITKMNEMRQNLSATAIIEILANHQKELDPLGRPVLLQIYDELLALHMWVAKEATTEASVQAKVEEVMSSMQRRDAGVVDVEVVWQTFDHVARAIKKMDKAVAAM
eukprot:TRINITY_DN19425_c0_g1_i3.p1 TRINITY_DN19425_c0_g1~~TRINITY_DN19425_c0_g1_i3.p1  ORF type:complete len:413 (-),score=107.98 TRINITY_DN19425_c0_g1_i3:536-1774(-)